MNHPLKQVQNGVEGKSGISLAKASAKSWTKVRIWMQLLLKHMPIRQPHSYSVPKLQEEIWTRLELGLIIALAGIFGQNLVCPRQQMPTSKLTFIPRQNETLAESWRFDKQKSCISDQSWLPLLPNPAVCLDSLGTSAPVSHPWKGRAASSLPRFTSGRPSGSQHLEILGCRAEQECLSLRQLCSGHKFCGAAGY